MEKLGMPGLSIVFKERASTLVKRGERGIVALVLRDENTEGKFTLFNELDIPVELSETNKEQIKLAFMGYRYPPRKIELVVEKSKGEEPLNIAGDSFKYLESKRFDYLAVPFADENFSNDLATWIKELGDVKGRTGKVVLANTPGDHERIINYTMPEVSTVDKTYTTSEYVSRIAGFIAGTPPEIATTFGVLPELVSCTNYTRDELESKIGNGEFVLYDDGEKIKCARGVNSLVSLTDIKGESFRKIKIVDILDIIYDDIKKVIEDNYLGKYGGLYDNKILIITAIKGYLEQLENDNLLERGTSDVQIDVAAVTEYLKSKGQSIENMELKEIKEANTGDNLFLFAEIKPLDAIENIKLPITIG